MALTKSDLQKIGNMIDERFREQDKTIDKRFAEQNIEIEKRFERQVEDIDALLTKHRSEFFTKTDPILKEVVASREERVLMNQRITALEEARVQ